MKTKTLSFFFTCALLSVNLWGQELKNKYSKEFEISGHWVIDLLRSHSTEDGGIYFTKLTFAEDASVLNSIEEKIRGCTLNQLLQLGLDANTDYKIVSAGKANTSLLSNKLDTTLLSSNLYAFVRSGEILKLALFPSEEGLTSEFGKFIILEVMNDLKSTKKEMHLGWALLGSEYILEKVENGTSPFYAPQIRNKSKTLNYEGLFGLVRSTYTRTFTARKMASGYVIGDEIVESTRTDFNKKGDIVKLTFLGPDMGLSSYSVTGDYNSNISVANKKSVYQSDSIRITRTNDTETSTYYTNQSYKFTTSLVNGQVSKIISSDSTNKREVVHTYNQRGDVKWIITKAGDYTEEKYFLYLTYDNKGNWTKRVSMQRAGNQKPELIEIRHIEYY